MGITGLIPFLSKSSRRANVREYAGQTVAIDAYCWLHKGAFSCADKLVMNEPTVVYVSYCMKFINMLLSHNIKPIMVFDGRHLPAKAETEKKRRESRLKNKQKGTELIRAGQVDEGRQFLRRSLDITHEMALNLIKECRSRNIDCIVAPHEADAQLAYFNIKNIAQVVITEDSDLLLFGCVKVLFKMDINGNGLLIEKDRLHISMGIRHDSFSIDTFRYMCILSGCDYLPSLPGIGLGKAKKFVENTSDQNIYEALLKLPEKLKMRSLVMTDNYREAFVEAERTFKHQLVYDPVKRKQIPLNETENENDFVGEKLDEDVAFELAIGNLDPMTLKRMDSYNPDKFSVQNLTFRRSNKNVPSHPSIWSRNYTPRVTKPKSSNIPVHFSTKGIVVTANLTPAVKRPIESDSSPESQISKDFLLDLYGSDRKQLQSEEVNDAEGLKNSNPDGSPILFQKKNPFALRLPLNSSTKKRCLGGLSRFKLDLESSELLNSRYFAGNESDPQTSSESSVFDLLSEKEKESSCKKTESDKSENEGERVVCSDKPVSSEELCDELGNSTSEIQKELSKFVFSAGKKLKNDPEDDETTCSQEENLCILSNNGKTLVDKEKYVSLSNCFTPEKTALTPLNRVSNIKKLYISEKLWETSDDAQTSPYFGRKSMGTVTLPVLVPSTRTPVRPVKNVSATRGTKKAVRSSATRCNPEKQQSLLTEFGFQPKSKF